LPVELCLSGHFGSVNGPISTRNGRTRPPRIFPRGLGQSPSMSQPSSPNGTSRPRVSERPPGASEAHPPSQLRCNASSLLRAPVSASARFLLGVSAMRPKLFSPRARARVLGTNPP
jgi:hypothetical protein